MKFSASQFNDRTMEYLIAGARITAVVAAAGTIVSVFGLIWQGAWQWLATSGVSLVVCLLSGFWGFYLQANEEWTRGRR